MKILLKILITTGVLWTVNWVLLCFISPSGVWFRREVREHPLAHPLPVTAVDGLTLTAGGHAFIIGGLVPLSDPEERATLTAFIRMATTQGIEMDGDAALPNGVSVRCEPRIWHGCGNDPVAAHYEQCSLNELLVAFGLVGLSPQVRLLETPVALRLRAAERAYANYGLSRRSSLSSADGIEASNFLGVYSMIDVYVYDIKYHKHTR
ncbi:MAG: hypothetical protein JWO94_958 [Verrucomicrobiaceae bacterium]|nr:hypothetical protein [Verrucomicrobiaceae bacterium]